MSQAWGSIVDLACLSGINTATLWCIQAGHETKQLFGLHVGLTAFWSMKMAVELVKSLEIYIGICKNECKLLLLLLVRHVFCPLRLQSHSRVCQKYCYEFKKCELA